MLESEERGSESGGQSQRRGQSVRVIRGRETEGQSQGTEGQETECQGERGQGTGDRESESGA